MLHPQQQTMQLDASQFPEEEGEGEAPPVRRQHYVASAGLLGLAKTQLRAMGDFFHAGGGGVPAQAQVQTQERARPFAEMARDAIVGLPEAQAECLNGLHACLQNSVVRVIKLLYFEFQVRLFAPDVRIVGPATPLLCDDARQQCRKWTQGKLLQVEETYDLAGEARSATTRVKSLLKDPTDALLALVRILRHVQKSYLAIFRDSVEAATAAMGQSAQTLMQGYGKLVHSFAETLDSAVPVVRADPRFRECLSESKTIKRIRAEFRRKLTRDDLQRMEALVPLSTLGPDLVCRYMQEEGCDVGECQIPEAFGELSMHLQNQFNLLRRIGTAVNTAYQVQLASIADRRRSGEARLAQWQSTFGGKLSRLRPAVLQGMDALLLARMVQAVSKGQEAVVLMAQGMCFAEEVKHLRGFAEPAAPPVEEEKIKEKEEEIKEKEEEIKEKEEEIKEKEEETKEKKEEEEEEIKEKEEEEEEEEEEKEKKEEEETEEEEEETDEVSDQD